MWIKKLRTNPLPVLLGTSDCALLYLIERDLMDAPARNIEHLWDLPEVNNILYHQRPDGSWRYKGNRPGEELGEAYDLLETWKKLKVLVEMYGFNNTHTSIEQAAEYIFSYQTIEGDIRGILSNQYMPYYMGAILEILIKAGYDKDLRVEKGLRWLLDFRQDDGGWIAPLLLFKMSDYYRICTQPPFKPKKNLPFSHMVTGMVIRAFAAHPYYKKSNEAKHAGNLLKGRFFRKDEYTSRQAESYWVKFQFPFWWTNLITALDSLARMGFSAEDGDIKRGLHWLQENQGKDGLWKASYGKKEMTDPDYWVSYAVCRILRISINKLLIVLLIKKNLKKLSLRNIGNHSVTLQ